jgi:hypothetical protein
VSRRSRQTGRTGSDCCLEATSEKSIKWLRQIIRLAAAIGCVQIALSQNDFALRLSKPRLSKYSRLNKRRPLNFKMEVTKALAALQPLYGKGNVEIVTRDGLRVRGIVRSMKTTQALTTPSVKVERGDGQIVKVPFSSIVEIIDHNKVASR